MAAASSGTQAKCPACGAIYQSHYATCLVDGETLEFVASELDETAPKRRWLTPLLLVGSALVVGGAATLMLLPQRSPGLEPMSQPLSPTPAVEAAAITQDDRRGTEPAAAPSPTPDVASAQNNPTASSAEGTADPPPAPRPSSATPVKQPDAGSAKPTPPKPTVAAKPQVPAAEPSPAEPEATPEPEPKSSFRSDDLKNPFD